MCWPAINCSFAVAVAWDAAAVAVSAVAGP